MKNNLVQYFNASANHLERIPVAVYPGRNEASHKVAAHMAKLIRDKASRGEPAVLGLATGSTPVRVYHELIRLHREEGLSFKDVHAFNLDEYYPIERTHRESYRRFMKEQLFDHIDIPPENIHIPDGEVDREEAFEQCRLYEESIQKVGGIDIQLLGIGRTGHIGFNEPGSGRDSRTRLVTLDSLTRRDAARDFLGEANVPRYAITMGVGTILEADQIILMAWGEGKAKAIARAVEEPASEQVPAGFLQLHEKAAIIMDEAASSQLTRSREPWRVRFVDWDDAMEYKAVTTLSLSTGKPVLKLVEKDYSENGLADLLTHRGPTYDLNIKVFNRIQHTITGWPGGKPGADDSNRPERADPPRKRVLIIASEPGEEVNGMGGSLHRLIHHGHSVHIACLTSGDLSVPDTEAASFLELLKALHEAEIEDLHLHSAGIGKIQSELSEKSHAEEDSPVLRRLKALIREGEERLSVGGLGLSPDNLHFLRLPFYTKGKYRQFNPGEGDVEAVAGLLREIQPHQVYCSGSKADPASVAGTGYGVVRSSLKAASAEAWYEDCRLWSYRGEGEEWPVYQVNMAVPLSPDELQAKSSAIFQHRTQRGGGPVSKAVDLDLWEMIEQRNCRTAKTYDALGMAEYEAIECFRRLKKSV